MIVKVQGGGKVYANTGSCSDVVSYLQHEDAERLQAGLTPEPFFNQEQDRISPKEVTNKIDNNRKGLKAKEAKFYVITVAPSREELRKMGATKEEQAAAMKEYIRTEVIQSETVCLCLRWKPEQSICLSNTNVREKKRKPPRTRIRQFYGQKPEGCSWETHLEGFLY